MEALLQSKRRSRWGTEPRTRKDGSVKITKPSQRDRELLWPILQRYKTLPANYIHALMGEGNKEYVCNHLADLSREPGCYLVRHRAQRRSADGNYRFQCYSLPETRLKDFWHDLLACMVMTQIELGAGAESLDLIGFDRILAKAPQATQALPRPASINLTYKGIKGRDMPGTVTADWTPFVIGNGKQGRFYFGLEADCHSETLDPTSPSQMSAETIAKKFLKYLAVNEQELARKIYRLNGPFFFPFVTDLPTRVESMQRLLLKLTNGKGSPYFLFRYFPSYDDYEKPPLPTGDLFTQPWIRAGFPDFYMNEL